MELALFLRAGYFMPSNLLFEYYVRVHDATATKST